MKRQALRVIPQYDPDNDIGAVDRVKFCIINGRIGDLTKPELEQLERWKQIDAWIRSKRYTVIGANGPEETVITGHAAIRELAIAFFNVSWDTAERDIANAKRFCCAKYDDQEYYRGVYIEDAERLAEKAENSARPDFKAAVKARELAARLRGHFDVRVTDIPNEKLDNFQFIIEYNPEAIGLKTIENKEELFEKWLSKNKRASDRMAQDAQDAEKED